MVTMMNPRVFADFVGIPSDGMVWNATANTFTFTGVHTFSGDPVVVVLTMGSATASVNGVSYDIAVYSGQEQLRGAIAPQIINERMYVPARFLSNAFGVPIEFSTGTVTLG